MKNRSASIALVLVTALIAACATPGPPPPARTVDGVLVNAAGMTLYTFDKDVGGSGKSVCNGPCATNWPPLMATGNAPSASWQVVTRDDGGKQWAYQGKPLYTWIKDAKPGDRTGDGVANAWRLARP